MRNALSICMLLVLGACTTQAPKPNGDEALEIGPPAKQQGTYYIAAPNAEQLIFHGQLHASEEENQAGGMAYPAYNVATFLVSIAAHSAVSGAVNKTKQGKARAAADKVLEPYQPMIAQLSPSSLLRESLFSLPKESKQGYKLMFADQLPAHNHWYVQINPAFIMASSEDSIAVETTIDIIESRYVDDRKQQALAYSKTVVVRSSPLDNKEAWLLAGDEFSAGTFADTLQELLASSILIALNDFSGALPDRPENKTTIRYLDNGRKKVERGHLISESCTHITFESLRGKIKSVPRMPRYKSCERFNK